MIATTKGGKQKSIMNVEGMNGTVRKTTNRVNCIDGKWKIKGEETEEMKGTQKCFVHLNDYKNVTQGILMKSLEEEKKQKLEAHTLLQYYGA